MPDCIGYLTGREYHHGSSIDFEIVREWAAGLVLLPFSFTGLILLPAEHKPCGNSGKWWDISFIDSRGSSRPDSCK